MKIKEKIKENKKGLISIFFGVLGLCYFYVIDHYFEVLRFKLIGIYYTEICALIFCFFSILGLIFGIRGKKSENRLNRILSLIGIFISLFGLLVIVGYFSLLFLLSLTAYGRH